MGKSGGKENSMLLQCLSFMEQARFDIWQRHAQQEFARVQEKLHIDTDTSGNQSSNFFSRKEAVSPGKIGS